MREVIFHKLTASKWRVSEWVNGYVETRTIMSPEQVGKRETALIREGFRLTTAPDSLNMRVYVKV